MKFTHILRQPGQHLSTQFVLLTLLATLGLLAGACGEPVTDETGETNTVADADTDETGPADETVTETDDVADADTDETEPADQTAAETGEGGELTIGALLAMTGGGSFYGDVMSAGAQLAVDEINEAGGVAGHTFRLVVEDHESGDADAGVSAARKLIDIDQVPVILSSFTAPTVAIQPIATEAGVLVLNGGGIGDELVGKEGLYNTRMLGGQLMPALIEWSLDEFGGTRYAVIHWNDAAGRAIRDAVETTCQQAGCEVVAAEPHEIDESNYSPMLARIAAADPDVLVLGSYGNDVGQIIDQARRQGLDIPIIGNEWTPDAQEIAGEAMEDYVAVVDNFDAENPANPEADAFVAAYSQEFGEQPEFYGANYYELVRYVVTDLVELASAEGQDPTQPGVLKDTLEQAVAAGHEFGTLYGETMTFVQDGTIQKPAGVYRVDEGSLVRFGVVEEGEVVED